MEEKFNQFLAGKEGRVIHKDDTNGQIGHQEMHFAFAFNVGTGQLEQWSVSEDSKLQLIFKVN